jgi:RNA polymerase sigma-70 factor, ECF subfamily
MGRHAANRPAFDPGDEPSPRAPLHSDLFAPPGPGGAARAAEERASEAFETLVAPHQSALHAYVLRLTDGDEAVTDSVIKETFYRAAQDPARYPQRASAVRPWLVLTARMVLRDGDRLAPAGHDDRPSSRTSRERSPTSVGRQTGAGQQTGAGRQTRATQQTTVVRALDELSAVHRDILVELFYRGVSLEEAAAVRGVTVETVKSRLYYAMRALRIVLDQQIADRHEAE